MEVSRPPLALAPYGASALRQKPIREPKGEVRPAQSRDRRGVGWGHGGPSQCGGGMHSPWTWGEGEGQGRDSVSPRQSPGGPLSSWRLGDSLTTPRACGRGRWIPRGSGGRVAQRRLKGTWIISPQTPTEPGHRWVARPARAKRQGAGVGGSLRAFSASRILLPGRVKDPETLRWAVEGRRS